MSSVRVCDNCDRHEGFIMGVQPSDQRWISLERAYWYSGDPHHFDFCSWPCVEAFSKRAQGVIDEAWEAARPDWLRR